MFPTEGLNGHFQLLGFVSNIIMKGCQLHETVLRYKRFILKAPYLTSGGWPKEKGGGNRRAQTHLTQGRLPACLYPALPGIFSAITTGPAVVFDRQGNDDTFAHRSTTVTACLAAFPFRPVRGRRKILLPDSAAGIGYIANIDFHSFYPLQKFMPTLGE
jgi:hypothetical protein